MASTRSVVGGFFVNSFGLRTLESTSVASKDSFSVLAFPKSEMGGVEKELHDPA